MIFAIFLKRRWKWSVNAARHFTSFSLSACFLLWRREGYTDSHVNRSEEVHISFSVMGEGSFHWPLKAAETRLNRHSDHKGKKWRTWCLAPWWQVAFRGGKKATTHPSFYCCTLSHTTPPPLPPHTHTHFGLVWYALRCVTQRRRRLICDLDGHLILSHRVGMGNMFGGWVSSTASVTIRALSLLSLCLWCVWGGGGRGVKKAADIVHQQVTVKRHSAF